MCERKSQFSVNHRTKQAISYTFSVTNCHLATLASTAASSTCKCSVELVDFASKNLVALTKCVGRVAGPGIVNLGSTEGKLNGLVRAPLEFLLLVALVLALLPGWLEFFQVYHQDLMTKRIGLWGIYRTILAGNKPVCNWGEATSCRPCESPILRGE